MSAASSLFSNLRPLIGAIALLAGTLAAAQGPAEDVYVNGRKLAPAEIASLARYSCGPVPPGRYWLDPETGFWGFANSSEVKGHIRERCSQRRPSLSERGQLYDPREVLEGNSDNDPIEGSDWGGPRQLGE